MGRPAHDDAITTIEYISQAAQTMAANHGIEVLVLHEGEVVEEYRPGAAAET
jgi:predicted transcriptional regulator